VALHGSIRVGSLNVKIDWRGDTSHLHALAQRTTMVRALASVATNWWRRGFWR